jgi:hypothetical protein
VPSSDLFLDLGHLDVELRDDLIRDGASLDGKGKVRIASAQK